ncbi:hypothetical protein WJX74_003850 [Apatococcus lobatus]|uniref:Uncharacterized protein n=1 Tax=Apatococcus lobatus TaxID=904363 RepID=A0AAW1RFK6_9CHLO
MDYCSVRTLQLQHSLDDGQRLLEKRPRLLNSSQRSALTTATTSLVQIRQDQRIGFRNVLGSGLRSGALDILVRSMAARRSPPGEHSKASMQLS